MWLGGGGVLVVRGVLDTWYVETAWTVKGIDKVPPSEENFHYFIIINRLSLNAHK